MRQLVIFILLAIAILSVSCERRAYENHKTQYTQDLLTGKLVLVEEDKLNVQASDMVTVTKFTELYLAKIDNCEYVVVKYVAEGVSITHHEACGNVNH